MDNTGVEFATQVARDFVIDPDPQDMISRINRVGMLLGVLVGTSTWTLLSAKASSVTGKEGREAWEEEKRNEL